MLSVDWLVFLWTINIYKSCNCILLTRCNIATDEMHIIIYTFMYHLCIKTSQCKMYVVINDFQLLISSEFFLGKQTNGIWALLLNTLKQLPSQKKRTFYHVIWMNQIFLIVMISSRVRKHHKKHNTPRYINYANYTSKGYGILPILQWSFMASKHFSSQVLLSEVST